MLTKYEIVQDFFGNTLEEGDIVAYPTFIGLNGMVYKKGKVKMTYWANNVEPTVVVEHHSLLNPLSIVEAKKCFLDVEEKNARTALEYLASEQGEDLTPPDSNQ